jgi:hypothetical protein
MQPPVCGIRFLGVILKASSYSLIMVSRSA